MQIVHESRTINRHDYNRETADRQLVCRAIRVQTAERDYLIELDLPAYIAGMLHTHDWDFVSAQLRAYGARIATEGGLIGATQSMIHSLLSTAAKKAIYDRFAAAQIRAGNAAWAVPMTIHGDQYHGVRNV